jgi:hypothetical protein
LKGNTTLSLSARQLVHCQANFATLLLGFEFAKQPQHPQHAALCNINPSLSCCRVELQVLLRSYMRPHYIDWL